MPVARFFFTPEFKKKNRNQQAARQTDRYKSKGIMNNSSRAFASCTVSAYSKNTYIIANLTL